MKVGSKLAVIATVENVALKLQWTGEWETWEELQNNQLLHVLFRTCSDLLRKAGKGMKGRKRLCRVAPSPQGQRRSSQVSPTGPAGHLDHTLWQHPRYFFFFLSLTISI